MMKTILFLSLAAFSLVASGAVWSGAVWATDEAARIRRVIAPTGDFSKPETYESLSAGAATFTGPVNADAFSHASANMSFQREFDFKVGNGIFRKVWVSSPSSTRASDGLGPLYNARACQRCHLKDGRGHPPAANPPADNSMGDDAVSMFLRLSIPPQTAEQQAALDSHRQSVVPEPTYGTQLQDFSVQGLLSEGRMFIDYQERPVTLGDGTIVSLRAPSYRIEDLNYGPLHPETMISPRVTPTMLGLGLLEAVSEEDVLSYADPDDRDGDGISGRANRVWSALHGKVMLGRFGWKAGQATVTDQSAGAFAGDIGLSTALHPDIWGDCSANQAACREAPGGADGGDLYEVPGDMFEMVDFYARNLAVPARRDPGAPRVLEGKRLFYESGCASCHRPKYVTPRDESRPEQSFQLIWPYSDLLLHDMGEGLADHRPEGEANGREWRTAPLWGIGLTETVNGHTFFLHDGRARNLLEAVLWHGGEAQAARDRVVAMAAGERATLLAFLNSL